MLPEAVVGVAVDGDADHVIADGVPVERRLCRDDARRPVDEERPSAVSVRLVSACKTRGIVMEESTRALCRRRGLHHVINSCKH